MLRKFVTVTILVLLGAAAHPAAAASIGSLEEAASRYRQLVAEGGWQPVPGEGPLKKGDSGERVVALRSRLAKTGELDPAHDNGSPEFDDALEQALIRFQQRHGEEGDGVVGPETLAALNIPAEQRLRQIELNLERSRSIASGQRSVFVNVPEFMLYAFEGGRTALEMRVVVGKAYQATPSFTDTIEYIIVNPYWNVPTSIAREELIPKVAKDPGYLARKNIQVVKGDGDDARVIGASSIDWAAAAAGGKFPYRLRQKPGAGNALGQIKFMLPNKHDIYLHDTPEDHLFEQNERTYSHGCIRVERPAELAAFLLRGTGWTAGKIRAAMASGKQQKITLPSKVPVHIGYQTAWVRNGLVHFREDVYSRDGVAPATASGADTGPSPSGR